MNGNRLASLALVCSMSFAAMGLGGCCCSASRGEACGDSAAEAQKLKQLDADWSAAAATRDAGKVAAFYADDAMAFPPGGKLAVGQEAARKVWASYFAEPSFKLSWTTTDAAAAGDLGYTCGTYVATFAGPDAKTAHEDGKFLCVWRKGADGRWKAWRDMWNADGP